MPKDLFLWMGLFRDICCTYVATDRINQTYGPSNLVFCLWEQPVTAASDEDARTPAVGTYGKNIETGE